MRRHALSRLEDDTGSDYCQFTCPQRLVCLLAAVIAGEQTELSAEILLMRQFWTMRSDEELSHSTNRQLKLTLSGPHAFG